MKTFIAAVLLLCATRLAAQEFDIFDANDFVDPRDRGAIYSAKRNTVIGGRDFLLIHASAGAVADYQWHDRPTQQNANFVQLAAGFYRDAGQANLKFTLLDAPHEAHIPRWRMTLQYARYFGHEDVPSDDVISPLLGSRISSRLLVSWSLERNTEHDVQKSPNGVFDLARHVYGNEYGMESDVCLQAPDFGTIVTSLVWMHKVIDRNKTLDRYSIFYRLPEVGRIGKRVRFNLATGIGAEKTDRLHWGTTRVIATAVIDISHVGGTLNIAYAPTFVPGVGKKFYNELTAYIDWTVLSRMSDLRYVLGAPVVKQ